MPDRVTIIGAGLCGLALAAELKSVTPALEVRVVEREADWARTCSAIPAALVTPWLDQGEGPNARIMERAFSYAIDFWDGLNDQSPGVWNATGVAITPKTEEEAARFRQLAKSRAGYLWDGQLHVEGAGWVVGVAALKALAQGIQITFGVDGTDLVAKEGEVVVHCCGAGLGGMFASDVWPIKPLGGQIITVGGLATAGPIKGDHYQIPVADSRTIIGATFQQGAAGLPSIEGRAELLSGAGLDEGAAAEDWWGVRAALPDHLPMMGPLPLLDDWREIFAPIQHGPFAIAGRVGPYKSGHYVLGGVGSRGFMSAPFLANQLAALITGRMPILMRDELAALHPGRYLIRKLRAGQVS